MPSSTQTTSLWEFLRHAPEHERTFSYQVLGALHWRGARVALMPDHLARQLQSSVLEHYSTSAQILRLQDIEDPKKNAIECAEVLQQGGVLCLSIEAAAQIHDCPTNAEAVSYDVGQQIAMDTITDYLDAHGYQREYQVEAPGEWARRGGVLDIWPPGARMPTRLDFWGDEVERMRVFDPLSQLSHATVNSLRVPACSFDTDTQTQPLWHWCSQAGMCLWQSEHAMAFLASLEDWDIHRASEFLAPAYKEHTFSPDPDMCSSFELPPALSGASKFPLEPRFLALRRLTQQGSSVVISVPDDRHFKALRTLAEPYSVRLHRLDQLDDRLLGDDKKPAVHCLIAPALPSVQLGKRLVLMDEGDLIEGGAYRQSRRPQQARKSSLALGELSHGDVVIHNQYGVGRYEGLVHRAFGNTVHDFVRIAYDGNDNVFLPVDRIYLLEKLQSGTEETKLDKLGSNRFAKRKQKAAEDALQYAHTLLSQAASRAVAETPALEEPGRICSALSLSFGFTLTPDQDRAIEEIYAAMASGKAMDRLLVGDVGFGKTEVAIRAIGYIVENGYQSVLLAPTTILAYQHARLIASRLGPLGIRVGYVNRFRTSQENRDTMRAFADGNIDVLVGTHRVLQRDFHAPRLGLVVVDEEHKFGVLQKEKLASLKSQAHRLSMSATPIPRSLNLALSGQRQISTIVTPPPSRQAVETNVIPADQALGQKILRRELDREGQVYVVAPHIKDLEDVEETIRAWAPEARIAVGHGQMSGHDLERIFLDFWEQKIDILISTSIVESGLDVGNANTMMIWNGHLFGLADLYQLRGRVGRTERRGYCYIVVPLAQTMTAKAKKRLEVIEKFTKLGSGYQIASYDLEIRGAGQLLGKKQSGHVQTIGMSLYARLLEEAIAEAQDLPIPHIPEPEIRTWFNTSLDPQLRLSDAERIDIYRQLFAIENQTEFDEQASYICDRYNLHPQDLSMIGLAAMARGYARTLGLSVLDWRADQVRLALHPESGLDRSELIETAIALKLRLTPDHIIVDLPEYDSEEAASDENDDSAQSYEIDPMAQQAASQWPLLQEKLAKLCQLIGQSV